MDLSQIMENMSKNIAFPSRWARFLEPQSKIRKDVQGDPFEIDSYRRHAKSVR
jgi:hypothetical protein